MIHTLIGKMYFGVYERPKNKIAQALTESILLSLGYIILYDIRVATCVFLSDSGANLNEDVVSLREVVCNILGKSHISKTRERYWVY